MPSVVLDALADGHQAAAQPAVHLGHVVGELLPRDLPLGHVDQVRAVVVVLAGEQPGGRQPAGVAAHDHVDLDARQRGVVAVVAHEGRGDEPRRRAVARAVVRDAQVVVDGLGDVEHPQLVVRRRGQVADDPGRVGRVVAADVEEVPHVRAWRRRRRSCWQYSSSGLSRVEPRAAAGVSASRSSRSSSRPLRATNCLVDDPADAVAGAVERFDGLAGRRRPR